LREGRAMALQRPRTGRLDLGDNSMQKKKNPDRLTEAGKCGRFGDEERRWEKTVAQSVKTGERWIRRQEEVSTEIRAGSVSGPRAT